MQQEDILRAVIPILILLIILEGAYYGVKRRTFPYKEALTSLGMFLIYQLVSLKLTKPWTQSISEWIYQYRLTTFDMTQWWHWIALYLGVEFAYYWMHRCSHEIRWLWASHSVHHSPHHITLSGAYRLSITSFISGMFIFYLGLQILGFSPKAGAIMLALNLLYQFWLHTELIPRLSFLEGIFNTPSNHRVHHSIEPEYIDKNYGGTLVIFDRIFGTYAAERSEGVKKYGVIGKNESFNPIVLFFREWVAMARDVGGTSSLKDKWKFCFGSPGWTPSKKEPVQSIASLSENDIHSFREFDQKAVGSK
ncbi:sterol desaturase family protein [Pseudobacteriovorax antillogorgiicola]|uniref:Sterol desaturase/sphingolipid hydroxylase, fatty acid hydroxylase superfamily n=1 Tax=Pseudobacteriovorax antillogorgiicola TaxID=1513793 RepID=A0A1Y6C4R9_9BACT|nr:sterol desaturase family protein [Pseudobacteriovorax antillogorgiicola]TCS49868.1 sterol desaturase/sphingolipid hydroxylase (fatty acid hydroxylase superfamily) [Pseudobacteriovorax antillogorgiicola]SMF43928.1 Sterol desaturase/sphingolipid hydroxylase, fatty acid hydroxylase superfamily [Pseudobacteriovorax antillogorgiicola]